MVLRRMRDGGTRPSVVLAENARWAMYYELSRRAGPKGLISPPWLVASLCWKVGAPQLDGGVGPLVD
jgi:hypothetical protein